jgi:D-alanyl-lipoteichoic acid acyltransferase DltB (MBOAT superfamily)
MLFNSLDFAIFLPIVFILYWLVTNNNLRLQNLLIVVASYIFYGWWDYRFLGLILFSTVVDYFIGLKLFSEPNTHRRVILLGISLSVNLGLLGFFKYYNFFLENFISVFTFFGVKFSAEPLQIILPVGISFYTFQTLSYSIDVYRRKLEPTKDFIAFAGFVSFFPQLVAGPIERATHLLPQFFKDRKLSLSCIKSGSQLILWGLFKKMVVADNCAEYANRIFNNYADYSAGSLLLGALFFTFQIYGDFSGYSDIAIGTARLFGFRLSKNFALPYFSRDIAEFWRRWHISLSTWFRDYLYIPLGGSRGGTWMKIRNVFIIFIVSGFWHGANWTFIFWGALNALYFLPLLLTNKNRQNLDIVAKEKLIPSFKEAISIISTFSLTVFAWIFFRSKNITEAFDYIGSIVMLKMDGSTLPAFGVHLYNYIGITVSVIYLLYAEFCFERNQKTISHWSLTLLFLLLFGVFKETSEFIYFQF